MTDTITSTLDILAIACIERPNDFAAWAALCDYCEEQGLRAYPRSLMWAMKFPDSISNEASTITVSLAYADDTRKTGAVQLAKREWATPLVRSNRK